MLPLVRKLLNQFMSKFYKISKYVYLSWGIIFSISKVNGQEITGMISDSSIGKSFKNASVYIINQRDSGLVAFTRTDSKGFFKIKTAITGRLVIQATYPGYAAYEDLIDSGKTQYHLGHIYMLRKDQLLKTFVFKGQKAITIKGDTIEFLADSFLNRPGANVEDLLKKLPGMTVDRTGKITAFGKTVEKVLVDGEEFFGDDPTIATKNLKAASVEKVQVIDQKSEQTLQSGIDDGEVTKTVNIILKEDAKKGYFGKVHGSYGNNVGKDLYDGQAMINQFKKKRKISGFIFTDNYNYDGLSWSDERKYGGMEYEYIEDGGYYSYNNFDEENPGRKGFPLNRSIGLHYSDQSANQKHKFNINYRFLQQEVKFSQRNYNRYIFPDSIYQQSELSDQIFGRNKNSFSLKYEFKIDSLTTFKLGFSSIYSIKNSSQQTTNSSIADFADTINSGYKSLAYSGQSQDQSLTMNLNKKYLKKGRSLNIGFTGNFNQKVYDGTLISENIFYLGTQGSQKYNQLKNTLQTGQKFSGRVLYTEPIGNSKWFAEVQYAFGSNVQASNLYSRNDGVTLDSLYSNDIKYTIITHQVGFFIKANKKKYDLKMGTSYNHTNLDQTNFFLQKTARYPFNNFIPEFSYTYKFTKQSEIRFRYNGRTVQPTLEEIQPLRDNTDPLNITTGNPNLKQEFDQTFSMMYYFYKVISGQNFWSGIDLTTMNQDIVYTYRINEQGVRFGQYTNVNGNYNLRAYAYYGVKFKKIYTGLRISPNYNYSQNAIFLNGLQGISIGQSLRPGISVYFEKDNLPEISLSYNPSWNNNTNSLNPNAITKYWQHALEGNVYYKLPKDFEITTEIDYLKRENINLGSGRNGYFIWNAGISKKVFKDKSGLLKLRMEDILKQRIGFDRSIYLSQVYENYYNMITRYFMFSFTWNFSDKKTKEAQKDDED